MNEHTLLNDVMATMSNTTNIPLSNWHKARKQEWQLKTTQVGRLILHIHKANLNTNIWVLGIVLIQWEKIVMSIIAIWLHMLLVT